MYECLAYMYVTCVRTEVCNAHGGQARPDPLELVLWTVMGHHVGAGEPTLQEQEPLLQSQRRLLQPVPKAQSTSWLDWKSEPFVEVWWLGFVIPAPRKMSKRLEDLGLAWASVGLFQENYTEGKGTLLL